MTQFREDTDVNALVVRLHRRARRLGASDTDAEDLAQETMLRLMLRMARCPLETPEAYAMTIVHNLMRARWRIRIETTELQDDHATTQPEADGRFALREMCSAIDALPPDQAQVMQMVLGGEQSPTAIAAALHLPVGTVMSRLARARATLRKGAGIATDAPVSELI